jgi:hypothetical protein
MMRLVFFHAEYCHGFCDGNARATVEEYQGVS